MSDPDVLVIDDQRTFRFAAVYARTAEAGLTRLDERGWRELWLDYDLGGGRTIGPVVDRLVDRASQGRPFAIEAIRVHTSAPAEGAAMVARLAPWYEVRRMLAHAYLVDTSR